MLIGKTIIYVIMALMAFISGSGLWLATFMLVHEYHKDRRDYSEEEV